MDPYNILVQTAIDEISKKFEIIGNPIDLSFLKEKNGEEKIFNDLLKLHRPVYQNNQRLLVIQNNSDRYSYEENFSADSLIFLQKYLQKIDISNFFVILISPNPLIKEELDWVRTRYSTDDCSIGYHHISTNFKKEYLQQDSFCFLPWVHLHINTNLEITPCCISERTKPWGSLRNNGVIDIINSDQAKKMRLQMLSGQKCPECETCYLKEKYSVDSRRMNTNKNYAYLKDQLLEQTNSDGSLKIFQPISLDIRLNNICNLKCRTCNGESSSQLAQEEKTLFNNNQAYEKIPSKKLRNGVLNKVIDYFNHAEEINFNGGEPLIMQEHYEILDRLIEIRKTDTKIFYNTNFTNLKFKNKNILQYWKKFSNVIVSASLDGHGPVFEYVRHGALWTDIEKNLDSLKKECPHVNFLVSSTISIFSAESVMELQKKWHESGTLNIDKFKINAVSSNDYFSLQTLFDHHKKYLAEKINAHCNWLVTVGEINLEKSWRNLQKMMLEENKSYKSLMIAPINKARDLARNETFELIYPQYADLFQNSKKLNFI